jgi:uncharacterized protein YyaL (SSP411 family)
LIQEQSPYLLQHAHNPVDWYPWGSEAFDLARRSNRPVFLSIGYATCHWCHVMERESFEDEEVARLMNDAFVSVKVDREERPDIDGIYMKFAQMATGSGGWPLTVIMTPDRRPFFVGTYFPKHGRFGRPGMLDLIPRIRGLWEERREELLSTADSVVEALRKVAGTNRGGRTLDAATLDQAFRELAGRFDRERGGFGTAPKFPTAHVLSFLLRYHRRSGIDQARVMAEETLDHMRRGGVYDQVGLGFHRYATDREWLVPHFEKMLYDQALALHAYLDAFEETRNPAYERVAREVVAYVARDLTAGEGGFFSAEDADSEGEEGKFYVWSREELDNVLGAEDGELAARVWGATVDGNYLDEATRRRTGTNILHLPRPLTEVANDLDMPPHELDERLQHLRRQLLAHREGRVRPLLDDKILTDWNGLMIAAVARAGRALDDVGLLEAAGRAEAFIWERMWNDGELFHRYRDGATGIVATLDDYAFLAWGELELHQGGLDTRHLRRAADLSEAMVDRFWDDRGGGLFVSQADQDDLIVRQKEVYDGAIPSGNSVAMLNLIRLSRLTGKPRYEQYAQEIVKAFSGEVAAHPSSYTQLLIALDVALAPSREIVIVGERGAEDTEAMLAVVRAHVDPGTVLLVRSPGRDGDQLVEIAPFLEDFGMIDGRATGYVCEGYVCQRPVTTVEELTVLLES